MLLAAKAGVAVSSAAPNANAIIPRMGSPLVIEWDFARDHAVQPVEAGRAGQIDGLSVIGETDIGHSFRDDDLAQNLALRGDDAHAAGAGGPEVAGAVRS